MIEREENMSIHQEAPPDARPPLSTAGTVARLTLIGVVLRGGRRDLRLSRRLAHAECVDSRAVHRRFRGSQWRPLRFPSQSRQGRWRFRFLREQRERRSALESGGLPAGPRAGARSFLAGGRPTLRARHGVRRARPGAPVLLAGRRTVANRDDPSAGVPVPHARSLLRESLRVQAGPRNAASPTPPRCRRFSPTIRKRRRR